MFFLLAPRVPQVPQPEPPAELAPFEHFEIPRRRGSGTLAATGFPPRREARGVVLLLHPWIAWGRAYFYRRGRVEALRQHGYHAVTVDLPGFGASGPPAGYFDLDIEDALLQVVERFRPLPVHVWGVSSGGYWAHPVLARTSLAAGAVFEDVACHLLRWSWRTAPLGRPGYVAFRCLFRRAWRFLDLYCHAPHLGAEPVAYVSGERDPGVLAEETRRLADRAGGTALIVPGATHLQGIKVQQQEVIQLALETFAAGEVSA